MWIKESTCNLGLTYGVWLQHVELEKKIGIHPKNKHTKVKMK